MLGKACRRLIRLMDESDVKPTSVISIREGQVRGAKGWSKGPVGSDRPRTSPFLTSKIVYILKF